MSRHENERGVYYDIPHSILVNKYHGCGNGYVLINTNNDQIIDMGYLDEDDVEIAGQNIAMHPDAGEILLVADHYTKYRANFSCCQACLF